MHHKLNQRARGSVAHSLKSASSNRMDLRQARAARAAGHLARRNNLAEERIYHRCRVWQSHLSQRESSFPQHV